MNSKEVVAAILTQIIVSKLDENVRLDQTGTEEVGKLTRDVIALYHQTLRLMNGD